MKRQTQDVSDSSFNHACLWRSNLPSFGKAANIAAGKIFVERRKGTTFAALSTAAQVIQAITILAQKLQRPRQIPPDA